jgi:MFS family permease
MGTGGQTVSDGTNGGTRANGHGSARRSIGSSVGRIAFARMVSLVGSYAASIALVFSIHEQTHSTAWISATMILTFGVMGFFGPVAGAISDRFDRRRVMIVGEIGAASAWALMASVPHTPSLLLGFAFCASLLESLFVPASSAAIPNLAGEEELARANSLIAIGRNAALTIGPLVGGLLLVVVGAQGVFVLNAVSFLVAAAIVASVRGSFADPTHTPTGTGEHDGFAAGVRFIASEPVLRQMLFSWVVFVLGTASTIVAEPALADKFNTGSLGYGLLTACWGGGTIIGAWLSRDVQREREALWIVSFSALMALTCFAVALSPWFGLILVWVAVFGLADGPTQVVEQNLLQRRTPDRIRGRVMGAWEAVMTGAFVGALLVGGVVVAHVGPSGAFVFAGIMGLGGSALLLPLLRWLRDGSSGPQEERPEARATLGLPRGTDPR